MTTTANLAKLVAVRSKWVEELQEYLDALAARCAELPEYYPKHLKVAEPGRTAFDDLRQTVQIVEDRRAFERWLAEERERRRAAGQETDQQAYAIRGLPEEEDDERRLQERERRAPPPPVSWDEFAAERFQRAVILGDPGFGKTWLLRYEARRAATAAAEQLRNRTVHLDDIVLPVFLRLSDLNRTRGALEKALARLVGRRPSPNFRRFVQHKIESAKCVLLLDAWDEVPGDREDLRERLRDLSGAFPNVRILLTSRIVGYDAVQPPIPGAQELELLAFNEPEIQSFAGVWFADAPEKANQFLAMIRGNHQVRGLARIPLMLSLMCRAYRAKEEGEEKELSFPTRRVDLYERCLKGLLRDWPTEDEKPGSAKARVRRSDAYVDEILELLADASLKFFAEGSEQFTESLFATKVRSWLRAHPGYKLHRHNAPDLIEELKEDGILIRAGEHRNAPLLFLHRTFQEYLAACSLSQQPNGVETALGNVYDPAWQEVLHLLGGTLKQRAAGYVAALLRKNAEDICLRPLSAAVDASAEAQEDALCQQFLDGLARKVLSLYFHQPQWANRGQMLSLVTACGQHTLPGLLRWLEDEDWHCRCDAADALGRIGSPEAVRPLLGRLEDGFMRVRWAAAEALEQIGSPQAMPQLLRRLEDEDVDVRWTAAKVLGRIGLPEAVPHLLRRLEDEVVRVCRAAAEALGRIGSPEAVPHLVRQLEDEDEESDVRWDAAEALGRIGSPEAVPHLLGRLEDEDWDVRGAAADALGRIGSVEAVPHLLGRLEDESPDVRCFAAEALGGIGSVEAVPHLVRRLEDEESDVREAAAEALGRMGSPEAVRPLLGRLEDEDLVVRCFAAEALGRIGSPEAVPHLLRRLADEVVRVRWDAAEALGCIGSPEAVPRLLGRLEDEDSNVRRAAAEALGRIRALEAVPHLLRRLEDEDVRWDAAKALGRIGSPEAVPGLLQRMEDKNWDVPVAAGDALGRIGWCEKMPIRPTGAPQAVREWMRELAEAMEKLAKIAEGSDKSEGPRPTKE